MTKRRPLIARFLLTLVVMLAISFQGVPLAKAKPAGPSQHHAAMPDATAPCHDMANGERTGDPATQQPQPRKEKVDPFACCAAFACGMFVQALPPERLPGHMAFTAHFIRPSGDTQLAPGAPDSAWRPPSFRA
ncbi:MAG: hypothetical protein JNL25_08420 [Rhodospirillaceae bacterium]|nr:hypothetical protein [Rhodospirillaceae bacterium]